MLAMLTINPVRQLQSGVRLKTLMFLGFLADHTGDCDSGCRRFESGRSPHFFRLKQPSDISCLTSCAKIVQIILALIGQSEVFNTSSPVIGSRAILKTKQELHMKYSDIKIGTKYIPVRGKKTTPHVHTVIDIYKTYNANAELVKPSYVATHDFLGQTVTEYDIPAATIARGAANLILSEVAK